MIESIKRVYREKIKKLEQENERMEKALREVEWSGEGEEGAFCLSCGELEADGHANTCLIRQALKGADPDA